MKLFISKIEHICIAKHFKIVFYCICNDFNLYPSFRFMTIENVKKNKRCCVASEMYIFILY